ncbi:hypothetical protein NDU88_008226 [Pleurodeles waltl]|uniref:Uncharacterized protein n=1 Tax=Pleurodeles waltl TaxID=8319 RepID=A0AAV7N4C8_PLEWA|nr:hypothetical protein NDU88_008226 [Pleurodeles waltl]
MVTGETRQRRAVTDISSCGPGGRQSLRRPSKLNNKTGAGSVKDVTKNGSGRSGGALTTDQTVSSGLKCKLQPVITDFLIKGAQDIGSTELPLPQEISNTYGMVNGVSINGILEPEQSGAKPVLTPSQMVEMQNMTENQTIELTGLKDGAGSAGFITDIDRIQSEYKRDQEGNLADILTEPNGTRASRNWNLVAEELLIMEKQNAESGQAEGDVRNADWSKEGGDKFYSLTEDSEGNSSDGVQSNKEDNLSSELETSLSSAIGPTFKQLQ